MPDLDTIASQNNPSDLDQVTNGPGTSADPSTPQTSQSDSAPQTSQASSSPAQTPPTQPQAPQPQPQAPQATSQTVSNQPAAHPLVQKASLIHDIAQTLAGGARQSVTIDPVTGKTTRTNTPLTGRQIGLAIAMEALSGGIAGISQPGGPNHLGRAAGAGFAQGQQVAQQRQQAQETQAKSDAEQQSQAFVRQAQNYEINSRTILNSSTAEKQGVETLKDLVGQNAGLLKSYDENGAVQQSNISQDALQAGLKSGQYDALKQTAVPDGIAYLNGKPELTFSIIQNSPKLELSQDQVQRYADGGVQGFQQYRTGSGREIPNGYQISASAIHQAELKLQANSLMSNEFQSVKDGLANSGDKSTAALANQIPDIGSLIKQDSPDGRALNLAVGKFQRYVSHTDASGDLYTQLQQMGKPSTLADPSNPKAGFVPNADAPFAQSIAGAIGGGDPKKGWAILKTFHDSVSPIAVQSEAQAQSLLSSPDSTLKQKQAATAFLQSSVTQAAAKAGAEARAKKAAGGGEGDGPVLGNPRLIGATNPSSGVNTAYLQSLPPQQRNLVQGIAEGRIEPPNPRTKQGAQLLEAVTSYASDYDASQFKTYSALQKDMTSGRSAQGLQALNTALGHLGKVFDNANVGSTTPIVSGVERLFGDKSASNLKAAQTAVTDELGRAYKSGVVSVDERKEWQRLIDGWTPASVKASAASLAELLDSKIQSYEQQLRNGAPSGAVRLPALMSPQAAQAYTRITGQSPSTSVGTNPVQRGVPSQLTNIQINPQSKQRIGWNGSAWVDAQTGQAVK